MKIITKISNFFSKKTISSSIRNKLMMDWSSEKIFFENRIKREKLRISEKRPHVVYYFHSLTDPYSHLTCQILESFVKRYDVELKILFVSDPHNVFTPERKMFIDYCLNDALNLANYHGLKFEYTGQPKEKNILIAHKILNFYFFQKEITQIDFIKLLIKISSSLWLNENDTFNEIFLSLGEKEKRIFDTLEKSLLKEGNDKLSEFGYYFGSSFHYEGENYWGIDRLNHLEDRLSELNLKTENSQPYIINYLQNNFNLEKFNHSQVDLKVEFFPSLNSPYTYISFKRIREIFEKYPVKFEIKPVLPMLMRNMKIPQVKARYILSDAAREGRKYGVIIKKIYSPIGKPAERAYSLFPIINDQGFGFDYLEKLMESCFFHGENIGEIKCLEKIISDLGLSWTEIKEELESHDWKKLLNNNLNEMYKGGCWGVPTVRLSNLNSDYEYYQWGQDRIHFIEKEIISILNFNHQ